MRNAKLTARQELFAHFFAATGNATESARLAGYKPGRGVRTTAWRLKTNADIRRLCEQRRKTAVRKLEDRVTNALLNEIELAITTGISSPRCNRAMRLMYRLGLYTENPFPRTRKEPQLQFTDEEYREILERIEARSKEPSNRTYR